MESDVGKIVLFQEPVETVADVVRGIGVDVCPFEVIGLAGVKNPAAEQSAAGFLWLKTQELVLTSS
jgi:hypothetical protein